MKHLLITWRLRGNRWRVRLPLSTLLTRLGLFDDDPLKRFSANPRPPYAPASIERNEVRRRWGWEEQ